MRVPWKLVLRSSVSLVLLALLVQRVHVSSLLPTWDLRTALWLGGALLLTLVGIVLSTIRWRQVLHALGLPTSLRPLLSHYFAGLFVGNFLPSTIGGDVLRVARLAAVNGDRPDTFASVVLERLTGWLVLPMLTLGAMAANPGLVRLGAASTVALTTSLLTLVLLVCTLAVVASPRLGGRLAGRPGWQRFAGAVHLGLGKLRRHPAAALGVLAAGFAYQLVVVLTGLLATRALDLDVSLTAAMAFLPAVAIAQVLPISLGGLGVREGALVLFLGPLGVPTASAVAVGLLVYGLNLCVSLLGAPAFALGGRGSSASRPPAVMRPAA
jgi:hypothetical protein